MYLMRAASRYEDPLPVMLFKVPGLHPTLLLQLLQMVATQEEVLQAKRVADENVSLANLQHVPSIASQE